MSSTQPTSEPEPQSQQISRETFILPCHLKNAINRGRMYVYDDEGRLIQTTLPKQYVESGTLPEGYCIDFGFDPIMIVTEMKKQGTLTVDQLPAGMLDEMREEINESSNLNIVPIDLFENKLRSMIAFLEK